ncbi:TetR family transcriptional regulator [Ruegeria sp. 2012CJ41-6]|uniref:TetR family transcriptional regulator n=1 Tax=Ruegeria spongiae TaxID=2942209 RepID=A0ABT0Q516_9RHOB|nr:TetR family transcriptional regulator [Ruegeria spongiae]MCL6284928.1 TetR family transcriptional regulator [Ruegeria spongiae]
MTQQHATAKRDADATRARILAAARAEFARSGLSGARIDDIAERAQANKRMIYHYFGNKEALFTAVLEAAYLHIRSAEQQLDLDSLDPRDALDRLVRFTWDYYLEHPELIALANSENLHQGRHIRRVDSLPQSARSLVDLVARILDRGQRAGVFRDGVDAAQLTITIAAIGCYYLATRYTGSLLFGHDMMAPDALDARLAFNLDAVHRMVAR